MSRHKSIPTAMRKNCMKNTITDVLTADANWNTKICR